MSTGGGDRGPTEVRIERDTMGEVAVPAWALWGASTQRAVENFPVSGQRVDRRIIAALAMVKAEAARVNGAHPDVPAVDPEMAEAIAGAAEEVVGGRHDDQFPVDVYQTGSGTSTNTNMNEVLAHLATERLGRPVHPNDHVNASQSSNDTFPTALCVATALALRDELVPALDHLQGTLAARARELAGVVKAGRTHLMDATPVTLGQELGGYATQVTDARRRIEAVLPRVCELPLGGTATGTGLNCPPGFAAAVIARLAERTGLGFLEAPDHFAAQGARDHLVEASGQVRVAAVALNKIANDLRWMGSGPAAGLAEVHLPDLQPGSSIMPGKVNPVICESVRQVVARVVGNDATVTWCGAHGDFELNVMMPVMGQALMESVAIVASVSRLLADKVVAGLTADVERCRWMAERSPAIATALNPHIGYERAAAVVKRALAEGRTIREVVVAEGLLSEEEAARILDVEAMTRGGILR